MHYPGLPSHPDHETAKRQMKLFSGMISFELHGGLETGIKMAEVRFIGSVIPTFTNKSIPLLENKMYLLQLTCKLLVGNKSKCIAQVQMLNLKFFEFPDIHREHQFKFFHCTLKAHLLPSSFLAKPPENLAGITHKVCLCIYVEPGSVNVPQK